jgi:hypothetical protein
VDLKTLYLREWLVIAVVLGAMLSVSLISYLNRRAVKRLPEKMLITPKCVKK